MAYFTAGFAIESRIKKHYNVVKFVHEIIVMSYCSTIRRKTSQTKDKEVKEEACRTEQVFAMS